MSTLNISLPEAMRDFIENQVRAGGYSTTSEYMRELVRKAQKEAAKAKLEEMLLEGLNSGPGIVPDEAYWNNKRQQLIQKFGAKQRK